MKDTILLLLVVQALRYLLFDHSLLQLLWKKFFNVPVLSAFLNCPFFQGFWLGLLLFFPFMNFIYALAWAFASAWLAAISHEWIRKRPEKTDSDDKNESSLDIQPLAGNDTQENLQAPICLLECNIDDMSGEFFGDIMQRLFALGALDVWFTSAYGKKNRPLYQLSALVNPADETEAIRAILTHSSTAGIRRRLTQRVVMQRSFVNVMIDGVNIAVKRLSWQDVIKYTPEWEGCAKASRQLNIPVAEIYTQAATLARKLNQN